MSFRSSNGLLILPRLRLGSVGPSLVGCHTRIAEPDPEGHGEIQMSGRNITMGYLNDEEKTR